MKERIRVFITKYALTQGIYEIDAETCPDISRNMVVDMRPEARGACYHGQDWHPNLEDAQARVDEMLKKERAKLERKLREFSKTETLARSVSRLG